MKPVKNLFLLSLAFVGLGFSPAVASTSTILVDFGLTAGHAQGSPTASPDANGVYWNNAASTTHGGNIAGGTGLTLSNLVTTANAPTTVSLQFHGSPSWLSAGFGNGGLHRNHPAVNSHPDLEIDGHTISLDTATEDYFFAENGPRTITISGLNVNSLYKLSMFGTRENTQARTSLYTITDRHGTWQTSLQTSGTGIGTGGYNGNNDTIVSVPNLVPDPNGTLTFSVQGSGPNPQFGYIGVLGITEVPGPAEGRVLVDFGPNNGINPGDGRVTPPGTPAINPGNGSTGAPDANEHYWNNVVGAGGANGPVAMSYLNLVNIDNIPTGIGLTLGPNWKSNGWSNGGLRVPDSGKLGDLAIATATEDYLFIDGATGNYATLNLNNLDPGKLYNLRFFATRDDPGVRKTTYTVSAGNGVFSTTLQTSGSGLGGANGGGNDSTLASLNGLQTDASAQLAIRVSIAEGGFAYLGILELTEAGDAPPIAGKKVRVDFGRHDTTNGNPTTSPDSFGTHWNNFATIANGSSVSNLVTTTNEATGLGITLTSGGWDYNGILSGGLLAPSSTLLRDLAVATATQDYLFTTSNATLRIRGLHPGKLHSLRLFGTRSETAVRRSTYTVTAGNGVFAGTLQTSGPGIGNHGVTPYNGNNRSLVALGGIQADHTGEVSLQLSVAEGGFAYLGILEIVEGASVPLLPVTNEIDRWTAQDLLDPVAPGAVLFVGSSSIRRWEALTKDFADYRIVQRGFGGSQFSDLNPIVNRIVTPYQPSAIVVFEGTNDIRVGNKTGETVFADFQTFVANVRATLPDVPVAYIAITPAPVYFSNETHNSRRVTANNLIAAHCASDPALKLHFFDTGAYFENLRVTDAAAWNAYFPDGLHLTPAGYAKWTETIRPLLAAIVPPNKPAHANPAALQAGEKLFFDFGPSQASVGDPTLGPDANGNHWNNWHATNSGGTVNSGEHLAGLIRSTGTNTGIRATITAGFQVNGKAGFGGLFAPNPALLGELAVGTATQDYFYSQRNIDDQPGGFMLEGLDPALSYEFRFFGSRDNAQTRVTGYTVHGANEGQQATLQTSGAGSGSGGSTGNDDDIAVIKGIRPDPFGQVFVDLDRLTGDFAHLNAMQIIASTPLTAWQEWQSDHFTPEELGNPALEATLWGNDADPDGDGLANLLEYAFGLNPRSSDATPVGFDLPGGELLARGVPAIYSVATGNGRDFRVVFVRRKGAHGLLCTPQFSHELSEWVDSAAAPVVIDGSDDEVELVSVRYPFFVNGRKARFFRLSVTEAP